MPFQENPGIMQNEFNISTKTNDILRSKRLMKKQFLEAADLYKNKDDFWSGVFKGCSKRSYPKKGFSIYMNTLSYKIGKGDSIVLPENDPEELASICIDFFRKWGICSPKEQDIINKNNIESVVHYEEITFDSFKSIAIRNKLIWQYIDEHYHPNSQHVKNRIFTLYCIGIDKKLITSEDIDFANDKIEKINGVIEYYPGKFKLEKEIPVKPSPSRSINKSFLCESCLDNVEHFDDL